MRNFNPESQATLAYARKEADRFLHSYVGTEHLLLGIFKVGGSACEIIERLTPGISAVRSSIERELKTGDEVTTGAIPYTPRVKKVLALANKNAGFLHDDYVGTEHILLGIVHEGEGIAGRVLKEYGLEINKLRGEISAHRNGTPRSEENAFEITSKETPANDKKVRRHALSEQPTDNDALGVAPYSEGLAAFVSAKETRLPLTISVEGNWGCGKTSFLMQVRKFLRSSKTVWFNPWRHDAGEALWAAFLVEFSEQVERKLPWRKLWKAKARFFWRGVRPLLPQKLASLAFLFSIAIGWFALRKWLIGKVEWNWEVIEAVVYVAPLLFALYKIWRNFSDGLKEDIGKLWKKDDAVARICAAERCSRRFREFLRVYLDEGERVYVFIDDLDRCAAPRAAELLDCLQLLISGNGDESDPFPVVFILGLDREKVAAGVAVKYEAMLPYVSSGMSDSISSRFEVGREFGYEYLQKFIDVPFRVPMPGDEQMSNYIEAMLGRGASVPNISGRAGGEDLVERVRGNSEIDPQQLDLLGISNLNLIVDDRIDELDLSSALKVASPMLGNNPRRLKQYLNLLRLRVLLAETTMLFQRGVMVQHLAKTVAIELARPVLYRKICEDSNLRIALSNGLTKENGVWEHDDIDTPEFASLVSFIGSHDMLWLRRWRQDLNSDLGRDGVMDQFPDANLLNLIVHLTAPPEEIEAKVAEEGVE